MHKFVSFHPGGYKCPGDDNVLVYFEAIFGPKQSFTTQHLEPISSQNKVSVAAEATKPKPNVSGFSDFWTCLKVWVRATSKRAAAAEDESFPGMQITTTEKIKLLKFFCFVPFRRKGKRRSESFLVLCLNLTQRVDRCYCSGGQGAATTFFFSFWTFSFFGSFLFQGIACRGLGLS